MLSESQQLYIRLFKRPLGFCGALMAIVVTSPVIFGTIVALYLANKNGFKGIFFTQERPGKGGKIFKVIKFKSMTDERDASGNLLPDVARLTKVGKFIRSTSIDELPQLFNILKGDMAFIGPRPLLVKYLPYYSEREKSRHIVRPGISGWAQVHGRNHVLWEERFEYDAYYVENISLKIDFNIFFLTIKKVFGRKDIEAAPNLMDFDEYRRQQANGRVFSKIEDAIIVG